MPWDDLEGPAKLLAICVAVFLVAAGLCGVQWFVVGVSGAGKAAIGTAMVLAVIEVIAMVASVVVGFVALIFWVVSFKGGKRGPGPGTQTLFPRENTPPDDEEKK
jgi:hypothetical protein